MPNSAPKLVVLDTDICNDVDDALALAMLHSLQSAGEVRLLAVTINTDDPDCATFVSIVNTYYGRPEIPIGLIRDGLAPEQQFKAATVNTECELVSAETSRYPSLLSNRSGPDGRLTYRRELVDGSKAPEAVKVLRQTLAAQADKSVTIIEIGFHTNLARLLESAPDAISPHDGRELVERKVELLAMMAGNFAEDKSEFNIAADRLAAAKVFSEWPTPIIVSGCEIGSQITMPADRIERDTSFDPDHPIATACREHSARISIIESGEVRDIAIVWPHDHRCFDPTVVLYTIRPNRGYFDLSATGTINILQNATTHFTPHVHGRHRHLVMNPEQKARALEAIIQLTTERPLVA